MMSSEVKWPCEYCTYENYPVSKKCVLCQAQRPLQVITDLENSEQDIYKVAESERKLTNPSASNKDRDGRWICLICTYANGSNSISCAGCKGMKNMTVVPGSPCRDKSKSLPTESSKVSATAVGATSGRTTPIKVSPTSPEAAPKDSTRSKPKDINKVVAMYVKTTMKWSCKACTYENWPKTKKCVICGTKRGKTYTEANMPSTSALLPAASSTDEDFSLHVETINQENIRSGQSSPNNYTNQSITASKVDSSSPLNNQARLGQCSPVSNNSDGQKPPNDENFVLNNKSGQNSPNNNRAASSLAGSKSGQISPNGGSGQSSPVIGREPGMRESQRNRQRNDNRQDSLIIQDGASAIGGQRDPSHERQIQKMRKKLSDTDLMWLNACEAIVSGDLNNVETFLSSGGDPSRTLTADEVFILDRPSAFEVGYTLVHLAIRFRRDDMVAVLLAATDLSSKGFKRLPSYSSPDIASDIKREISISLRRGKGNFPCCYFTDCATFALPTDIEDLPRQIQNQLFEELLDSDVDKELTEDLIINWSIELTEKFGSRLYALWNRTAGDCLLDSVLQATWGILDIDNTLRNALSDSLMEAADKFYPTWKEYETMQAHLLNFTLDEGQLQRDWSVLLNLASQPGASLEQLHIFVLAHILRRPIIVYGVKVVKSFRGESIDFARFEGVYLPLLWERNFCFKNPIALGYTRGHFSALVPMEIDTDIPIGAGATIDNTADEQIAYLPLVTHDIVNFLPIHFVTGAETCMDETLLRRWLDCYVTPDGLFVAIQKIGRRPPLVKQMIDVWMDHYRHQSTMTEEEEEEECPGENIQAQAFSSDEESDQE